MSKKANTLLNIVPSAGGSVRVTIASNAGQGNGGNSLPCKKCWIVGDSANTGTVRVEIGDACGSTEGIPVPEFGTNHFVLDLEIDDVSKLYFYGSVDGDKVDILYRR